MILLFLIVFYHWIADFVLQTHWQATNKSRNWNALSRHAAVYTSWMTLALLNINIFKHAPLEFDVFLLFWLITFVTHFVTDAITSRITGHLYKKEKFHNFFVVIGFDQVVHYGTLFYTLHWLGYNAS